MGCPTPDESWQTPPHSCRLDSAQRQRITSPSSSTTTINTITSNNPYDDDEQEEDEEGEGRSIAMGIGISIGKRRRRSSLCKSPVLFCDYKRLTCAWFCLLKDANEVQKMFGNYGPNQTQVEILKGLETGIKEEKRFRNHLYM